MARRHRQPKGLKEVEKRLAKALKGVVDGAHSGLIKGGLLVEKRSKQNVPVRTGDLRSSGYSMSSGGVSGPEPGFTGPQAGEVARSDTVGKGEAAAAIAAKRSRKIDSIAVGHTAFYAASVHENSNAGAAGYDGKADTANKTAEKVHSKVGGWKFLENALKESTQQILKLMASGARIK